MDFGGSNFEQAPTGVHKAKLFSIVDLGTQTGTYDNKPTVNRQLHFTWELVNKHKEDGKPYVISKFYNQSLGDRSAFIQDITSWFGKAPAIPSKNEEKGPFVLELLNSLLGKGCQLVIVDKEGKHKISTVTGLDEDTKLADGTVNETLFFDLDSYDEDTFEKVPKGIQGIVQRSPEYAKAIGATDGPELPVAAEDDVPF